MSLVIVPIAFDGKTFEDYGVSAGFAYTSQAGPAIQPSIVTRVDAPPIYGGSVQAARPLTIDFTVLPGEDVAHRIMGILAAVQPGITTERLLIGEIGGAGPNAGTQLQMTCSTGQYRYGSRNNVLIDFIAADDKWYELVDTDLPEVAITRNNTSPDYGEFFGVLPLFNPSGIPVNPTIKLSEVTTRLTGTQTVGWKYRKQVTITNNGTRNWNRVRKTIDLGDVAALVSAGKISTDGNNIRIHSEGREYTRTLTNYNTKRCLAHIVVTIPAGQSQTFDVVYGNAAADSAPLNLSTRTGNRDTYAADDLEGTSGTATAGAGSTLTDGGKAWETNRWRYGYIQITGGTGSGQRRRIASNTGTVITVDRAWGTNPDNTSTYVIWMTGISVNGGKASGAGTTSTLTDASQSFGVNELKGGSLYNVTKGIGPFEILGNTATVITTATMTAPALNDVYYVERYGVIQWFVNGAVTETAHRGLWRINKYHSVGSKARYGDQVPGGWSPWLMVANNDDFAQGRYIDEGAGGGHTVNNWPYLYARRSARSDNTWPEEGQADGAAFYDPRGFVGFDWNYNMQNEGGVGQVVVKTQEPGGDDWQTIASDSTTRAAAVSVTAGNAAGYWDLTGDDAEPVRIYCGVIPADGEAIPSTQKKGRKVQLKNQNKMVAYLSLDDCGGLSGGIWSVGAEEQIYDIATTLRLGGGWDEVAPFDVIQLGGADHYIHIKTTEELWINTQPNTQHPLFGIYDSSGDLVESVPWAGVIDRYEDDITGGVSSTGASNFLRVPPAINLLDGVADRISGWTLTNAVGVTAALSDVSTPDFDGNSQAIRIQFTTTPVGAWSANINRTITGLLAETLYEFGAVVRRTSLDAGIVVTINVNWLKADLSNSTVDAADTSFAQTLYNAATWFGLGAGHRIHGATTAADATAAAELSITVSGSGSLTGSVYVDQILFGVPNLYISEYAIAGIRAAASYRGGQFG